MTSTLSMSRTSKLRFAGAAFFALFFLVLQPTCAAYVRHIGALPVAIAATTHDAGDGAGASHGSHDDGTPCCSEMQADAIASESSVATGKNFTGAQVFAALPYALAILPRLNVRYRLAPIPPPFQTLSYYTRSARIQR